jgi:hypothetical protein
MSAAVAPPTIGPPIETDPATGFKLLQQPIYLIATSPVLANGNPLTLPAASGYTIDPGTAKAGFTFGALLYQSLGGVVKISDGNGNWIPETAFDPSTTPFKPIALAFDTTTNQWTSIFVIATLKDAAAPSFATPASGTKYGFITVFTSPKSAPTTAVRSALGTPFGVIAAASNQQVQPGLLQGLIPTQDASHADGFAIIVNDKSQTRVADLIVSSDTNLSQMVMVRFYSGGVVRASVALDNDGSVHLTSAMQVTLDAPIVQVTGTLQAQNIEYLPYGGSTETFLL